MEQSLFRREVIDARHGSWLGGISLAQPLNLWVLTAGAMLATSCVGLLLAFGTYTHRSPVVGQLVPSRGMAMVLAPATGVVSSVDAVEGSQVGAGQRLAVVVVPRATPVGGDTQVALEQRFGQRRDGLVSAQNAQQRQLRAQGEGARTQLAAARNEFAQIEVEVATRRSQAHIANETLDRLRQLQARQYVSAMQVKQQESTTLDYIGQMQALQQQAAQSQRTIAQLEQALRELPGQQQAVSATFRRDMAQLETERVQTEAQGALAVTAPVEGVVATQLVKPGQAVQAGQPLMSLLPGDGKLEAELLVPSRAIGFVSPGDRVSLRYQAYPYQKFGHYPGIVARISRNALSGSELGASGGNAQQGEPLYRVTVALARQSVTAYGKRESLKPGMLLEADILGDRRRLFEWAFEPLYSLKRAVIDP
jgi:membrane fusion protein